MKKIIILTILLLTATVVLAWLYFSNLSVEGNRSERVISQIPADAGVILEFTNDKTFYEIFRDYSLFSEIIGDEQQKKLEQLKHVFTGDSITSGLLDQQKIFVSLHHEKSGVAFLWTSSLSKAVPAEQLTNYFSGTIEKSDENIYQVTIKNLPEPFYFYIDGDVVSGSFSRSLIQSVANPKASKISKELLSRIGNSTTGNENSLLNLHISHQTLLPFLSKYYREKLGGNYALLNNTKGFSTLNMNFKSDAVMFNGITDIDTTSANYLKLFLNQKPGTATLHRIIPLSTANFIHFNLSDYQTFSKDLKVLFNSREELERLSDQITKIGKETGINTERDIKELWTTEFISFQTANHERYGAVRVKDSRKLEFLLEPISEPISPDIRRLMYSNIFYYYFGDVFKAFKRPYFIVMDNYLVFANSLSAIRNYLDDYKEENFLPKTPKFISFEQLLPNQANVSLFMHNGNSKSLIRSNLKSAFARNFTSTDFGLNNFYGVSYQWSSDEGHFFTNLCIGYKQKEEFIPFSTDSLLRDTSLKHIDRD